MANSKALVLFSGGPDSTAAALWGIDNGFEVELLSFLFTLNKTDGELRSAMNVAQRLGVRHTIIDLKDFLHFFGDGVKPMMHGGTRAPEHGGGKRRLLPFGAGVALSIASSVAIHLGIKTLIWGATKDDGSSRVDYRQEFADTVAASINLVDEGIGFKIQVPHADKHKFQLLAAYQTREELFALTWSCTEANADQCGACHACLARRIAARVAKIADRTAYERSEFTAPLSDAQLDDPSSVDPETWYHILESEKAPQF